MSYYIRYDDTILLLNAHRDISVSYPAKVTSHPTAARVNSSDNYLLDNPTATFFGEVTDVIIPSSQNPLGAGGYIDKLRSLMLQQRPVKFKHRLDGEEENNWFITNINPSQDSTHGWGADKPDNGGVVQSFKISVSLEQVRLAVGITEEVKVPVAYKDALQVEEKKTSVSKTHAADSPKAKTNEEKAAEAGKTSAEAVTEAARLFKEAGQLESEGGT